MKFFFLCFSFIFHYLAIVSAKKDVKIELAYQLLARELVKQNGKIDSNVDCEPTCPAGSNLTKVFFFQILIFFKSFFDTNSK